MNHYLPVSNHKTTDIAAYLAAKSAMMSRATPLARRVSLFISATQEPRRFDKGPWYQLVVLSTAERDEPT